MSDFAYRSAYSIFMEAEARCHGATEWLWAFRDTPSPAVVLTWRLTDCLHNQKCSVSAEGPTFEMALIKLASRFLETQLATDIRLTMSNSRRKTFIGMTVLDGYEIRLECVEAKRIALAAYEKGVQIAAVEDVCFEYALDKLVHTLHPKPVIQMVNPLRFASQWRFLANKLRYYWEEGMCLQKIAAADPETGLVDSVSPANNTKTYTFLGYSDLNPEFAPRSCSGSTFEAALDLFARSFGWEAPEQKYLQRIKECV